MGRQESNQTNKHYALLTKVLFALTKVREQMNSLPASAWVKVQNFQNPELLKFMS